MPPDRSATRWRSLPRAVARRVRRRLIEGSPARPDPAGKRPPGALVATARQASAERRWHDAVEAWAAVIEAREGPMATARTRLANAHRRVGDLESAAEVLAVGVARFPEHVGLATEHAQLATKQQDWPEAVRRWQRVISLTEPEPPADAFLQLTRAFQKLDDLAGADEVLEQGLALHPDDLELASHHAQLASADRDWPEVVRRWGSVLELAGDRAPARAYVQLARAHQAHGDVEAAEQVLELGRQRRPEDRTLAIRWAKLAGATRRWEVAFERYTTVVEMSGQAPPDVHRDRARAAAEMEAWDLAEAALARGLEQHPGDPLLAVERAFLSLHRGVWSDVDAHWAEATSSTEVPADLYVGMARRCAAAFDHERADAVVAAGLDRYPDDRGLHRQLVRNAISLQRRERAPEDWDWADALERAQRMLPTYADDSVPLDHLRLATELADTTALHEAIVVLRAGLEIHPRANELRQEIGVLAGALGRWHDASEQFAALAAAPDPPFSTRSALARSLLGRGDHQGAVTALGEPSAWADDARSHGELARIAAATGDHAAAADAWRTAYDLAPSSLSTARSWATSLRRAGDEAGAAAVVATAHAAGVALESNPGVVAIIGGGPSLRGVDLTPLRGIVHTVAVNATATVLPWSDVAVTHDPSHLVERFRGYDGPVVAGLPLAAMANRGSLPGFHFRRRLVTDRLSEFGDVVHSGGHTSAHTALNYAYLLRPRRIVLFGIDLTGFWGPNDYWHGSMDSFNKLRYADLEARATFDRWSEYRARKLENAPAVFASTLPQLEATEVDVLNASPVSSLDCFVRTTPEEGLAACLEDDLSSRL